MRPRLSDVKDVLIPCALITNHCVLLQRQVPFRAQVWYLLTEQSPPRETRSGIAAMLWGYLARN